MPARPIFAASAISFAMLWSPQIHVQAQDLGMVPDVVEGGAPSVVSIATRTTRSETDEKAKPTEFSNLPDGHPMKEFFNKKNAKQKGSSADAKGKSGAKPKTSSSQGSGLIVSADGYIATAVYVVDGADQITVTLDDGANRPARIVGVDKRSGIALLKIEPSSPLSPVTFADSSKVRRGSPVVAIGNPFGLGNSASLGIISATDRNAGSGPYNFLQTDASINRGHSGGALLDFTGKVVGMSTSIVSPTGGNVGVAFAVPSNLVRDVVAQLKESGTVDRGWLGIRIQNVSEDLAQSLGLSSQSGALVAGVDEGTPAYAAGVKTGDIVLSVDEDEVANSRALARLVGARKPDETVKLAIVREGQTMTVPVTLGKLPTSGPPSKSSKPAKASTDHSLASALGLSFAAISDGKKGAVIAFVEPNTDAATKGLSAGDVIAEVGGEPVANLDDLKKTIAKAQEDGRKAVLLSVTSKGTTRFVALKLADE